LIVVTLIAGSTLYIISSTKTSINIIIIIINNIIINNMTVLDLYLIKTTKSKV